MKATLLIAILLALVGCSTVSPGSRPLTTAEIAERVCPAVQTTLSALQSLNGLDDNDRSNLAKGQTIVTAMCAPGGIPSRVDLETIIEKGAPLAISIINWSDLDTDEKNRAILGVTMIQVMAQGLLQAQGSLAR